MALDPASRRWALLAMAACLSPLLLQLPGQIGWAVAALAICVSALSWRRPMPGWLRFLLALAVIALVLKMSRFSIGRDTGCAGYERDCRCARLALCRTRG